jgi:hypothetical protein
MAQQPIDRNQQAREKRDLARRARRLAQTQLLDADRERLTQFAAELDKEAEALEWRSPAISLPPETAPQSQVQQQQQSAASPTKPNVPAGEPRD